MNEKDMFCIHTFNQTFLREDYMTEYITIVTSIIYQVFSLVDFLMA